MCVATGDRLKAVLFADAWLVTIKRSDFRMMFSPLTQWLWFADVNKTGFLYSRVVFGGSLTQLRAFSGCWCEFFRHARTDDLRLLIK